MISMAKRFIRIAIPLIIICTIFIVWSWPRNLESIAEISENKVSQVTLQADFEDSVITLNSEAIKTLYTFSFSMPVYCKVLRFDCKSYNLTIVGSEGYKRLTLLENGTLWDGTWHYKVIAPASTTVSIEQWLQLAIS